MNCENPVIALRLTTSHETGKSVIKIIPISNRTDYNLQMLEERYGKDSILRLPCGRCTACKESYRADWSVRCDMEARYYQESCFLTLTYREEVCPRWVSKGHLRRFIKALNTAGIHCKYFACGEYGESVKTPKHPEGRPHYHVILFGYFPVDAQLVPGAKTKSGFEVYQSKFLDQIWNKGFVQVTDFSQNAAFYVAGYVNKKTGKYDGFLNMSRGIGYQYMEDHLHELFIQRNYISRNGSVHFVPRAFKRVCEKNGYVSEEDPKVIINSRKMENSEMIQRGYTHREMLRGIVSHKMQDKLTKRLKRL